MAGVLENRKRVGKAKVWLSCVNVVSRKTDEKESEMYLCCWCQRKMVENKLCSCPGCLGDKKKEKAL